MVQHAMQHMKSLWISSPQIGEKSALVFNRKSRRTQPYNFEPLVWSNFYSCSFQLCQREMFLYIFNGPCNFSFNYGPNPPLRYFTVHPTQNYPYLWCTGTLSQFSLLYFFIVILPHILSCCKEENSFWSVHPIFYTIQLVCVHSQAILRGPSCRWDRFKLSPGWEWGDVCSTKKGDECKWPTSRIYFPGNKGIPNNRHLVEGWRKKSG